MTTTYIDPLKTATEHYRLLFEDEHVRVLEMSLPAGQIDNEHSHPEETVIFLQGGRVRVHLPDGGTAELDLPDGHIMWHESWTHRVENIGSKDIRAFIVEDKRSL
jgi:quercetin dioxygenase-like cupin family protein